MKKLLILSILLFFSSCSMFDESLFQKSPIEIELEKYSKNTSTQVLQQLEMLVQDYLKNDTKNIIMVNHSCEQYLIDKYEKIVGNNELMLNRTIKPKFHFIKNDLPFVFSLPTGNFFMSSSLLEKYVRSENLLLSALTYEIIRNHSNVYPSKIIVPIGFIGVERLIFLTRIPTEVKLEIHKLAYQAIKRSGYDGASYLSWLQLQNKNSLDFTLHLGDVRSISKEEFGFKSYIVNEGVFDGKNQTYSHNSSQEFYKFIKCFIKE